MPCIVFLGPITSRRHESGQAPIVFFGEAASRAAGAALAAGDINRDALKNDLVISAPGGAGGAGEAAIYYGRSRSAIGVLQPDGRRFVDMAASGQINRHIFGDPGIGAISSVQVFEVTGEGARDVIVGVPGCRSRAGKLYLHDFPEAASVADDGVDDRQSGRFDDVHDGHKRHQSQRRRYGVDSGFPGERPGG